MPASILLVVSAVFSEFEAPHVSNRGVTTPPFGFATGIVDMGGCGRLRGWSDGVATAAVVGLVEATKNRFGTHSERLFM